MCIHKKSWCERQSRERCKMTRRYNQGRVDFAWIMYHWRENLFWVSLYNVPSYIYVHFLCLALAGRTWSIVPDTASCGEKGFRSLDGCAVYPLSLLSPLRLYSSLSLLFVARLAGPPRERPWWWLAARSRRLERALSSGRRASDAPSSSPNADLYVSPPQ